MTIIFIVFFIWMQIYSFEFLLDNRQLQKIWRLKLNILNYLNIHFYIIFYVFFHTNEFSNSINFTIKLLKEGYFRE